VGAFIFGIEPEINVIVLYGETIVKGFTCGTGSDSIESVPCPFDHLLFELVHIYFIGISLFNIERKIDICGIWLCPLSYAIFKRQPSPTAPFDTAWRPLRERLAERKTA
jgi:hypothetical protein